MSIERVERIIFRFSRQEVAAMLKLMDSEKLPGLSVRAEYPEERIVDRLVQGGIVMPCGKWMLVDRTVSLVLRSAAESSRYLAAKSSSGEAALYATEKLWVLIENTQSTIVRAEPLRDFQSAQKSWGMAVRNFGSKMSLTLETGRETRALTGDINAAKELLAQLKDSEV